MSKQFTVKVPTLNLVGIVAPLVKRIDDRKSYRAGRDFMKAQITEEGRLIREAQALAEEQIKVAKEAAKAEKVEVVS